MKTFEQIFKEHIEWTHATFPLGTSQGAITHLHREAKEVEWAIHFNESKANKTIEFADMWGCIADAMFREGITFEEVVQAWEKKLQINKTRECKYNGDGSYSHIKQNQSHTTN